MKRVLRNTVIHGGRAWRALAGENSTLEKYVRSRVLNRGGRTKVARSGETTVYKQSNAMVFDGGSGPEPKRGIYMVGGCDLPPLFLAGPQIARNISAGVLAMDRKPGWVGAATTSQLLQTFEGVPDDVKAEASDRLQLDPEFFEGVFFEKTFVPHRIDRFGAFPKDVVILSIGSDLVRSLHRHREYGFLVDLGGWWLNQSLEKAVKDTDTLQWYKTNFEQVGKASVEEFATNLETVVNRIRSEIGAHVIVLNTLVIDPLKRDHNYQLSNPGHITRKREFNIVLAELSAKLGFHVLDVDRSLKGHGVQEATDFAHFPIESKEPVAREGFRILEELGVL